MLTRNDAMIYYVETKYDLISIARNMSFVLPMIFIPSILYFVYAVLATTHKSSDHSVVLFAALAAFSTMGPGLFGFGLEVAADQAAGRLTMKRVYPLPPGAYLIPKILTTMIIALLAFVVMTAVAIGTTGLSFNLSQWLLLALCTTLGTIPFCAIGLTIGLYFNVQAAAGIANIVYIFMSFLSGIFMKITSLPKFLQHLAPIWPSYQLSKLFQSAIGLSKGTHALSHIMILFAFLAIFSVISERKYRKTEDR